MYLVKRYIFQLFLLASIMFTPFIGANLEARGNEANTIRGNTDKEVAWGVYYGRGGYRRGYYGPRRHYYRGYRRNWYRPHRYRYRYNYPRYRYRSYHYDPGYYYYSSPGYRYYW